MQTNKMPLFEDSENRKKTLLRGADSFKILAQEGKHENLLLLGLGADVEELQKLTLLYKKIYYMEHPKFYEYLTAHQKEVVETANVFERIFPENFENIPKACHVYIYTQNPLLFEGFWQEIIAQLKVRTFQTYHINNKGKLGEPALLLGLNKNHLLAKELEFAAKSLGYTPIFIDENTTEEQKTKIVDSAHIQCFLSVNGQGLTSSFYYELKQKHIPTLMWFVDNPYNILSKYTSSWWKEVDLAVTDPAFIPALEWENSKKVNYLPLAGHTLFKEREEVAVNSVFFAGSYQFSGYNSFFSAVKLTHEEKTLCEQIHSPNFLDYWQEEKPLFLSKNLRKCSYKATLSTQYLRKTLLKSLNPLGLTLMGDKGWNEENENIFSLIPQADYYSLGSWYAKAPLSLALPSMLLPSALNQRHFDVWNSEGFLLSVHNKPISACNSLRIFPEIPLPHSSLPPYFIEDSKLLFKTGEFYLNHPEIRSEISYLWRKILKNHTYSHRLQQVLSLFP